MEPLQGRAWKYGDHVNTDVIVPGRYLKLTARECAPHVMEGIDPAFTRKAKPGDIVVGGVNFGCGSSRETAPAALKEFGIAAVVARFFARIFFRNAINVGLPVLECAEADRIRTGDELRLDLEAGRIANLTRGETYSVTALPPHIVAMIRAGGLVPFLEAQIRSGQLQVRPAPPPLPPRPAAGSHRFRGGLRGE